MPNLETIKDLPSQQKLWELFDYDPETGELSNNDTGHIYGSRKYNTKNSAKYIKAIIDNKYFVIHRIIWTMVHGQIPKGMTIDHINHDSRDNRISNLRLATLSQQQQNRRSWSKFGYRGINMIKGKYYAATIHFNRQTVYLGCFSTAEEAAAAYDEASKKYHGQYAGPSTVASSA